MFTTFWNSKSRRTMSFVDMLLISMLFLLVDGNDQKRIILHSDNDIALEFQKLRQEIDGLKANFTYEMEALKKTHAQEIESLKLNYTRDNDFKGSICPVNKSFRVQFPTRLHIVLSCDRGSTYVRWGRTSCGGNGTEKVYSGFTAGTPYDRNGGAASFVCLPQHPTWAKYMDGQQTYRGKISGTKYEIVSFSPFPQNMNNQDAPCVVCRSPNPTTIMIPGRTNCFSGWTMEYNGYLMSDMSIDKGATDYACVDANPEAVYHGEENLNGKLFYFIETKCGSLPCQEYPDGRELSCVVCSK